MGIEERLLAISPLDGRYADAVQVLSPIVSEYGLIERRVRIITSWVGTLGSGTLANVRPLSIKNQKVLAAIADDFTVKDAIRIKGIERRTNHDANAAVRWVKDRLESVPALKAYVEFVHYGCTSEDVNNLAIALMLRDVKNEVLLPSLRILEDVLDVLSQTYAATPMLARTHGQPASPTTLGKEIAVYRERLHRHVKELDAITILGKFSGATGNYNALTLAYPEVDWPKVSRQFVESFGFAFNNATTQIEPHDWMARFFNEVALGNIILTDLSKDMWLYIMLGYFKQHVNPKEDGSSAMPHKVNPINFENAEANFGLANATLNHLAAKLPMSRLQRDLSDSSAQRAIGEAFGHTVVAQASLMKGLGKIYPDTQKIAHDLDKEWSVLTEALQVTMRRYGVKGAYDSIKAASRGKSFSQEDYIKLVEEIQIPEEAKERLRKLTPATYIGRATDIAKSNIRS